MLGHVVTRYQIDLLFTVWYHSSHAASRYARTDNGKHYDYRDSYLFKKSFGSGLRRPLLLLLSLN